MKNKFILKGKIITRGIFQGRVKVINDPSDPADFKNKDVLVAAKYDPKFNRLIKKAGAVLFDEKTGVAQLKALCSKADIPCAVGTKKAAKILEDKFYIEVDCFGRFAKIDLLDHSTVARDHQKYRNYHRECHIKKLFPKRGSG